MSNPPSRGVQGRVALVTGASGGIGKMLARRLAELDVDLFLTYGTHGDDVDECAEYARSLGRRVVVTSADLSDPSVPSQLVESAQRELGAVDILIANAGTATRSDYPDIDLDLWNSTLAVNLTAPFLLAQKALAAMIDRRFGRILFMSSVAALNGGVVGAHYAASKAALHGLMHHLAPRVAGHGVTVNALAPALIGETRMLPLDPDTGDAPLPIPVQRLGRPSEVADMAIAMVTNEYLTDKVITLDGGLIPR
jgi:3-oxoacyl-[acyl-carrier protein] reductase